MTKARDIATNEVVTGEIGSTIQAYDADLDSIAALDKTDGSVIVGDGTNWVAESGATARTSLGLGTAATTNSTDYATAAQGALADSALQSIAAGSVGTTELANNAVTSAKLDTNISVPGTVTATSFVGSGASLTGIAGGFSNLQVFTSSGTWTNPGSVTKVKVTVVGGGGNGGTAPGPSPGSVATGGGAGGAAIEVIPFPSGTNVPVTVGGVGGTSSFGGYCSATGGGAGVSVNPSFGRIGGAGGSGSGGTINITGGKGGGGGVAVPVYLGITGKGGETIFGGGGAPIALASGTDENGDPGSGYGAGGSGGGCVYSAGPKPGGAGKPGVIIIEY